MTVDNPKGVAVRDYFENAMMSAAQKNPQDFKKLLQETVFNSLKNEGGLFA